MGKTRAAFQRRGSSKATTGRVKRVDPPVGNPSGNVLPRISTGPVAPPPDPGPAAATKYGAKLHELRELINI